MNVEVHCLGAIMSMGQDDIFWYPGCWSQLLFTIHALLSYPRENNLP